MLCSTGWVVPILLWDSEGWLCRSVRINKVSGKGSGSCRCGVCKVVADQCCIYLVSSPYLEFSLACKLVV